MHARAEGSEAGEPAQGKEAEAGDEVTERRRDPHTPPCRHNRWSRVRKMRGDWGVLLRCLDETCKESWVTKMALHEKCKDFYNGTCLKGGDCSSPHIYARAAKNKDDERGKAKERSGDAGGSGGGGGDSVFAPSPSDNGLRLPCFRSFAATDEDVHAGPGAHSIQSGALGLSSVAAGSDRACAATHETAGAAEGLQP